MYFFKSDANKSFNQTEAGEESWQGKAGTLALSGDWRVSICGVISRPSRFRAKVDIGIGGVGSRVSLWRITLDSSGVSGCWASRLCITVGPTTIDTEDRRIDLQGIDASVGTFDNLVVGERDVIQVTLVKDYVLPGIAKSL